jgi:hypothetical protein
VVPISQPILSPLHPNAFLVVVTPIENIFCTVYFVPQKWHPLHTDFAYCMLWQYQLTALTVIADQFQAKIFSL